MYKDYFQPNFDRIFVWFDLLPINVEFSGDNVAIFRVGVVSEHRNSLQHFKHPMIFWQNVKESCTFQKIYGVGIVKL